MEEEGLHQVRPLALEMPAKLPRRRKKVQGPSGPEAVHLNLGLPKGGHAGGLSQCRLWAQAIHDRRESRTIEPRGQGH